jgi:hypothetical protein
MKPPPKLRNNFMVEEKKYFKDSVSSSILSIDANEEANAKSFYGIQNFETNNIV